VIEKVTQIYVYASLASTRFVESVAVLVRVERQPAITQENMMTEVFWQKLWALLCYCYQ
jgi:hypothetical protein